MSTNRYIGSYPVIGIRPTIDGRRGVLGVRESLEEQTMNMARTAAKPYLEICGKNVAISSHDLRDFLRKAYVHIWCDRDAVIYANERYIVYDRDGALLLEVIE